MTWAKVDDQLHGHPKAIRAGLAAMGLWTLALSHCAAYLTDGRVTRDVVARLSGSRDEGEKLAARLVEVELWESDEDGYRFHDYLHHNPSAKAVKRERKKAAERQAKSRDKSRRDIAVTSPAPSRPVPVPEKKESPPNPPNGGQGRQDLFEVPPGEKPTRKPRVPPAERKHAFTPAEIGEAFGGGAQERAALGAIDRALLTRVYRTIDTVAEAKRDLGHVRLAGEFMRAHPFERPSGTIGWDTIVQSGWLLGRIDAALKWDGSGRASTAPRPAVTRAPPDRFAAERASKAEIERELSGAPLFDDLPPEEKRHAG